MAIVFSQGIFLWADLLTDLTGSGSDDGITTDQIAWAEDQNNWYYCTATAATTSTWVALLTGGPTGGIAGVLYNGNQFYVDANDRNSYSGSGTTLTDMINSLSGTMASVTITDGHFNFNGTTGSITFSLDANTEDIFDGGGTAVFWLRPETVGESTSEGGRIADTSDSVVAPGEGWGLYLEDSGGAGVFTVRFTQAFNTTAGVWASTGTLQPNQWALVAVTYDNGAVGNNPTFYFNGFTDSTPSPTITPVGSRVTDTGNNLVLGNRSADDNTFDGDLDFGILFDRALSLDEIRQLFAVTGPDRFRPSVVGVDASQATSDAQQVLIQSGTGGSTSGDAGDILIQGGTVTSGGGGAISILGTDAIGSGNAGGTILIEAGGGSSLASAGDVQIAPGVGATGRGNVIINNNGGADTEEVLRLSSEGTNSGSSNVFVGSQTPVSAVTAIGAGDLYVRTDTGNLYQAQSGGSGSWVQFATTATAASAGIPGTVYEDLLFYVDSADRNSYAASGLVANDLMANATGGTLSVGLTFEDTAWNFTGTTSQATGTVTVAGPLLGSETITINGIVLTNANGPRTSGNDDFDGTLSTDAAIAGDIVAAINDVANSFTSTVTASNGGTAVVTLTAVPLGTAGNVLTLASSDAVRLAVSGSTLTGGTGQDYIEFTKPSALDNIFATGGTLMAWVRLADDGEASNGVIIDTSDDADAGYILSTVGASSGHVSIRFQRNWSTSSGGIWTTDLVTQPWTGSNDDAVHLGSWTSIIVTYDDQVSTNQPTFYINGTVVSNTQNTAASGVAQSDAGNPVTLGNIGTGLDRCLNGQISVVHLWDRTLDADEIQRAHSAFAPRFGQGMRGMDSRQIGSGTFSNISGQDIWIRGGDSLPISNSETEGGHIYIIAGDHIGGGNTAAGRIYIKSGDGGGNVSGSSEILIETGASTLGNALTIRQSNVNTGSTPDGITIQAADNDGSGNAGDILIRAGAPTSSSRTAQPVTVRGGDGGDAGGTNIGGGAATFRAGDGAGTDFGGDCTVRGGNSGASGGQGGDLDLLAGNSNGGNNVGGTVTIAAGTATGSSQAGDVLITAGANSSASNGRGGHVDITAGNSTDDDGGRVLITTGSSVTTDSNDPAGSFTVLTGSQTGGGGSSGSGAGDAVFTLGSCAGTNTGSTGGKFTVDCGDGTANSANSRGGSASITGGDVTGTTAGAVAGGITLTGGQATGAAGTSGSVTCAGGAAGFSAGTAGSFNGVGGAGNSSAGGGANLTGGAGSGANAGGAAAVQGGAGGATGNGGAAQVAGGTGGGTSGNGGIVNVDGGDASAGTNGDGGDVAVAGGSADGTGTPGEITLTTDDTTAPVGIRTTSGFVGTECEHLTYGTQDLVNAGTTDQTVVTLGTLDTDGQNMKITVEVTAVDNADDSNFIGFTYTQYFYRDGGTVNSVSAFDNQQAVVGIGDWGAGNVTFNVASPGASDDILLRVSNSSSVTNYTMNVAVCWRRQEGGFAS